MPFPLPECPEYRKLVVTFWLDDVDDRIQISQLKDAESSWRTANDLYLTLPPGTGDMELEDRIFAARVKLDNITDATNANNL